MLLVISGIKKSVLHQDKECASTQFANNNGKRLGQHQVR